MTQSSFPDLYSRDVEWNNVSQTSLHLNFSCAVSLFGLVWFGLVLYYLVWFGKVWFGMVWFGTVWFGIVWFVGVLDQYGRSGLNAGVYFKSFYKRFSNH